MRIGRAIIVFTGVLGAAGCDEAGRTPAEATQDPEAAVMRDATPRPGEAGLPASGLPPFGQRAGLERDTGSWMQQLTPDETEACRFAEKSPSERPPGLVVAAWSGNMDLLTEGYVLGHDHAIGFVEAMWMKEKPEIAAREGMDDLWIEPIGDLTNTILRIGADELTCVIWAG